VIAAGRNQDGKNTRCDTGKIPLRGERGYMKHAEGFKRTTTMWYVGPRSWKEKNSNKDQRKLYSPTHDTPLFRRGESSQVIPSQISNRGEVQPESNTAHDSPGKIPFPIREKYPLRYGKNTLAKP